MKKIKHTLLCEVLGYNAELCDRYLAAPDENIVFESEEQKDDYIFWVQKRREDLNSDNPPSVNLLLVSGLNDCAKEKRLRFINEQLSRLSKDHKYKNAVLEEIKNKISKSVARMDRMVTIISLKSEALPDPSHEKGLLERLNSINNTHKSFQESSLNNMDFILGLDPEDPEFDEISSSAVSSLCRSILLVKSFYASLLEPINLYVNFVSENEILTHEFMRAMRDEMAAEIILIDDLLLSADNLLSGPSESDKYTGFVLERMREEIQLVVFAAVVAGFEPAAEAVNPADAVRAPAIAPAASNAAAKPAVEVSQEVSRTAAPKMKIN